MSKPKNIFLIILLTLAVTLAFVVVNNKPKVENINKQSDDIAEIEDPGFEIPEDIKKETDPISFFQKGDVYFALIRQPSMNVRSKSSENTDFFGVLIAYKYERSWKKLLEIGDNEEGVKNNPYYLWTEGDKYKLSIVDQTGAGSGEGKMKILTSSDLKNWELTECYYFGENYDSPEEDGDYFEYSKKIDEQRTLPQDECSNLTWETL